jgi:hypothetical protein
MMTGQTARAPAVRQKISLKLFVIFLLIPQKYYDKVMNVSFQIVWSYLLIVVYSMLESLIYWQCHKIN